MTTTRRLALTPVRRMPMVRVGGTEYQLAQFHFHAHSEHAVDGAFHPLELHFVHSDASGAKLVLAVFIDEGAENPVLQSAEWSKLPAQPMATFSNPGAHFNAAALLPSGPAYRYTGSLTTPPCSENVQWLVYQKPITLSHAQIALFTAIYDHNFRPTEPLGARAVTLGE